MNLNLNPNLSPNLKKLMDEATELGAAAAAAAEKPTFKMRVRVPYRVLMELESAVDRLDTDREIIVLAAITDWLQKHPID